MGKDKEGGGVSCARKASTPPDPTPHPKSTHDGVPVRARVRAGVCAAGAGRCGCGAKRTQAYAEVASSVAPFIKANPEYAKALEIISIPERIVQFR
jgi:hypothetical protein